MKINYLGRDLYEKIDKLVNKAFHDQYTYCDTNWYSVDKIILDYECIDEDEDDDTPIINIEVRYRNQGNVYSCKLDYRPDKSDEFNIGRMVGEFER